MSRVALRRSRQNESAPQDSQGCTHRALKVAVAATLGRSGAHSGVSSSLRQWGWSKTRLTCFKSTVLMRSRAASKRDGTHRFLAERRIPSYDRTMRASASSVKVLWARATRSSWAWMKSAMTSGASLCSCCAPLCDRKPMPNWHRMISRRIPRIHRKSEPLTS